MYETEYKGVEMKKLFIEPTIKKCEKSLDKITLNMNGYGWMEPHPEKDLGGNTWQRKGK
jgi:hypothetical protein